jgi:hypothetical protein
MDMRGRPETKAVFHVTRGPMSRLRLCRMCLGVCGVGERGVVSICGDGEAEHPMVSGGGREAEPLRAEHSAYTMGSDPRCLSGFVVRDTWRFI